MFTPNKKGFTLLEILLVVGIISVLAGIVIVAINPGKQLATVRNTERKSDIKQIYNALNHYYIDNRSYPTSTPTILTEICDTGINESGVISCNPSFVDMSVLVPKYITAIPKDPKVTNIGGTGYEVMKDSSNKIIIIAASAELNTVVAIGTTTVRNITTPITCDTFTYTPWTTCVGGTQTQTVATQAPPGCTGGTPVLSQNCTMTYTVSFDSNLGTGSISPQAINQGSTTNLIINSNNITRTGYTFAGWNTLANGLGTAYADQDLYTMGGGSVTLYAQWSLIPTYNIIYDGNTNTSGTVPSDTNSYLSGATVTVATGGSLAKTGYLFTGWNTLANGLGTDRAAATTFAIGSGDVTLYAQWAAIPTYSVTYSGNTNTSGTVPSDTNSYLSGATVTVATVGSLAKTGYLFTGWNTLANGLGTDRAAATTFAIGSGDVTLYAKWAVDPCVVSGDATDPDCWSSEVASKTWGPYPSTTGVSTATTTVSGKSNTAILYAITPGVDDYPAADYCYVLNQGGVPDGTWYLPSYTQLMTGWTTFGRSRFPSNTYWSAIEFSDKYAWFLDTSINNMNYTFKHGGRNLRCIR